MLNLDPLGLAPHWVRFLLVIRDRLPLAKRSKVYCSIESRTYLDRAGFYPK
ncbi:hypothetical protein Osc7112_4031 [Oscillatoria nigro-viridis PCC 7112]|uniref:Uncharacterized protein n=1 Tax=Phormidium nigroviride PCC 7112 TaxID=179408 RepID=K9VLE8_9CYAN|nr:hypothetical protein [Oscillatoria nigro-viridis]AFZ08364.1 hypothetical protein Osc7112_4031 [Oscillatoria nigro-viridis PCC 7112]